MKKAVLYVCYNPVTDPLVASQVIAYLRELALRGYRIHLLTFEQHRLSRVERAELRKALAADGIAWHALRYHGRPSLPATLYDIVAGSITAFVLCLAHGVRFVHARSHVPAAMALPLRWLLRCRLLFDVRGLLADEYADAGRWKTTDVKYRLTKAMERVLLKRADAFVMLTEAIKRELVATEPALGGRAADVTVIPCCVDTRKFEPWRAARRARGASQAGARRVLVYLGKLGGWYLVEEMVRFFRALREHDDRFVLQVLTQSDPKALEGALADAAAVQFVPADKVAEALSLADAGVCLILPSPSKRASSPTKLGEYLAAGLPVVANAGVGDVARLLDGRRAGVLLAGFSDAELRRGARDLAALLDDPETPERCARLAEAALSLEAVGVPRYAALYERLTSR